MQAYDLNRELLYPENRRDKIIDAQSHIFEELSVIEKEHYRLFDIIVKLKAELKGKDETLQKIKTWCDAFSFDVFPRLTKDDWKQAAEVLKANGLSLDRISADNMRLILDRIKEII